MHTWQADIYYAYGLLFLICSYSGILLKVELIIENRNQDHTNWYESDVSSVLETLDVTPEQGLSEAQVGKRQERHGKNVL